MAGQLFGLQKEEIATKLEEIVKFSGQGAHMDTPVKHYSSGMFLRLAFSVATTFPSDILLLDEVMSVGDMKFQEESVDRIRQITSSGTTVIFASHELPAILMLCNKVMLLENGMISRFGAPNKIIEEYLEKEAFSELLGNETIAEGEAMSARGPQNPEKTNDFEPTVDIEASISNTISELENLESTNLNFDVTVHDAFVYADQKERTDTISADDKVCLYIDFSKDWEGPIILSAVFTDKFRNNLMSFCNYRPLRKEEHVETSLPGRYALRLRLPEGFLNAGLFRVNLYFANAQQITTLALEDYLSFRISPSGYRLKEYHNIGNYTGPLYPLGEWSRA